MNPCVWQSELRSAPLDHTTAPKDDFLIDEQPAQSLSEELSRRSGPLRGHAVTWYVHK